MYFESTAVYTVPVIYSCSDAVICTCYCSCCGWGTSSCNV